ncbi:MAG: LIC_10190 family membrane protein, partial [Gammaproteobacteria bacterium]
ILWPLDAAVVCAVLLVGVTLAAKFFWAGRSEFRVTAWGLTAVIVFVLVAVWIGARSAATPTNFDAGLYYLQAMRWMHEYPIVPGLANLHSRLGFNQSSLIWAAALDFYPYGGSGRSIGNGSLVLVALLSFSWTIRAAIGRLTVFEERVTLLAVSLGVLVPAMLMPLLIQQWTTAPVPDAIVMLLQFAIFAGFMVDLEAWSRDEQAQGPLLLSVALLAGVAVTVKLSTAVFCFCIVCFCIFRAFSLGVGTVLRVVAAPTLVVSVWVCRNYILSGTAAYPLAFTRLPFEWAVPLARIHEDAEWISSWARMPGMPLPEAVLMHDWIGPWFNRVRANPLVVQPLIGASMLTFAAGAMALIPRHELKRRARAWFCLVPPFASCVFWFLTAPDPRFTLGAAWCLFAAAGTVFYSEALGLRWSRVALPALVIVVLTINSAFVQSLLQGRGSAHTAAIEGQSALPAGLTQRITDSGLLVNIAGGDGRCWDAPLPCTPYFDPSLALRSSGELGSGFVSGGGAP